MSARTSLLTGPLLLASLLLSSMPAAGQGTVLLHRSVIAQGGVDGHGATMTLRGTIGQSVAGRARESGTTASFGFWYGLQHVLAVSPPATDRSALHIDAIWPQPASERLLLRFSAPQSQALQLSVTDLLGRLLIRRPARAAPGGAGTEALPVSSLQPGMYFLTVHGEDGWHAVPFVVLR